MKFLSSFIFSVVLTLIALKYFPIPYLWICLCWFSCFLFFTLITKTALYKGVWFNATFIFLLFGITEVFSWVSMDDIRFEGGYNEGYFSLNDILGYAPPKGRSITSKKYKGKKLLYTVTYTIGTNGLRISSPDELINNHQCIVFFGDSITFGEGVEDHESMPYLVSKLSKYKVYNFGFHGYGPHQMLSALEHGIVDRIMDCTPRIAIYQAFVGHVARSAGLSPWDRHGPRYLLLSDGTLKYDDHFDDNSSMSSANDCSAITLMIKVQIKKSFVYKKYFKNYRRGINERDVKLFLEIMDTSRVRFITDYPGSSFHIIMWDYDPNDKYYKMIREGFYNKGFNLHIISNILPNFLGQQYKYQIIGDGHPNAIAHRYIAKYVTETILGMESSHKVERTRAD